MLKFFDSPIEGLGLVYRGPFSLSEPTHYRTWVRWTSLLDGCFANAT